MSQKIQSSVPLSHNFRVGLSDIIDMFSAQSTQVCQIIHSHLAKLPKPASNEMYARFNASFTRNVKEPNGIRDPNLGKALLDENLEFIVLTNSIMEVADDVCIFKQITSLFQKRAPTQTILGTYKQFSSSAKAVIEAHLGETALKAAPEKLQKTLIDLFGGMDPEDPSKDIQKSLSLSASGPKCDMLWMKNQLFKNATIIKNDIAHFKQCQDLLFNRKASPEAYLDMINGFSIYAQVLIRQNLILWRVFDMDDFLGADVLHDVIIGSPDALVLHSTTDNIRSATTNLFKSLAPGSQSKPHKKSRLEDLVPGNVDPLIKCILSCYTALYPVIFKFLQHSVVQEDLSDEKFIELFNERLEDLDLSKVEVHANELIDLVKIIDPLKGSDEE